MDIQLQNQHTDAKTMIFVYVLVGRNELYSYGIKKTN